MRQTTLPDYHFLLIPPTLGAEWFFDAARGYWERYQPTVISDLEFAALVPETADVVITVLSRRDQIDDIGVEIAQQLPNALFDPVVQDTFEAMRSTLNRRAADNAPFGVPLPTPVPATPIRPTPGPLIGGSPAPTRAPAGFITQTPSPTPQTEPVDGETTPPPAPTEGAPATAEPPRNPLDPTPGPIIGG